MHGFIGHIFLLNNTVLDAGCPFGLQPYRIIWTLFPLQFQAASPGLRIRYDQRTAAPRTALALAEQYLSSDKWIACSTAADRRGSGIVKDLIERNLALDLRHGARIIEYRNGTGSGQLTRSSSMPPCRSASLALRRLPRWARSPGRRRHWRETCPRRGCFDAVSAAASNRFACDEVRRPCLINRFAMASAEIGVGDLAICSRRLARVRAESSSLFLPKPQGNVR